MCIHVKNTSNNIVIFFSFYVGMGQGGLYSRQGRGWGQGVLRGLAPQDSCIITQV